MRKKNSGHVSCLSATETNNHPLCHQGPMANCSSFLHSLLYDLKTIPLRPQGRAIHRPLAAMDMRALNVKAGGPFFTPRRNPPATWAPPPSAETGSLAIGARQQSARWPKLAVSASGKKSRNSPDRGDGDEPRNKASSSGNFSSFSTMIGFSRFRCRLERL